VRADDDCSPLDGSDASTCDGSPSPGDVRADDDDYSPLDGSTSSGDVRADDDDCSPLDGSTSSGDVRADDDDDCSPLDGSTSSGDVRADDGAHWPSGHARSWRDALRSVDARDDWASPCGASGDSLPTARWGAPRPWARGT
jgi:hypothetical protein